MELTEIKPTVPDDGLKEIIFKTVIRQLSNSKVSILKAEDQQPCTEMAIARVYLDESIKMLASVTGLESYVPISNVDSTPKQKKVKVKVEPVSIPAEDDEDSEESSDEEEDTVKKPLALKKPPMKKRAPAKKPKSDE